MHACTYHRLAGVTLSQYECSGACLVVLENGLTEQELYVRCRFVLHTSDNSDWGSTHKPTQEPGREGGREGGRKGGGEGGETAVTVEMVVAPLHSLSLHQNIESPPWLHHQPAFFDSLPSSLTPPRLLPQNGAWSAQATRASWASWGPPRKWHSLSWRPWEREGRL